MKHLQGTNFKAFRKEFKGDLLSAFLVPANIFDNVTGKFPIGFFVWRLGENVSRGGAEVIPLREEKSAVFTSAVADVYDRDGEFQGTKCIIAPDGFTNIISWLRESYDKSGARIAYLRMNGTNVQNNEGIFISQALTKNDLDNHFYAEITARNLMRFSVYYAVRKCIDVSWVTYQDQYAYPDAAVDLDETFLSNCLVFTLFDDKNRVKSSDGVNHWIPFT